MMRRLSGKDLRPALDNGDASTRKDRLWVVISDYGLRVVKFFAVRQRQVR